MDIVLPEPYTNWEKRLISKYSDNPYSQESDDLVIGSYGYNKLFFLDRVPTQRRDHDQAPRFSFICTNTGEKNGLEQFTYLYSKEGDGEWEQIEIEGAILGARAGFDIYILSSRQKYEKNTPASTRENVAFNAIEDNQLGGKRRAKKRRRSTRRLRRRSTRKSRRRTRK